MPAPKALMLWFRTSTKLASTTLSDNPVTFSILVKSSRQRESEGSLHFLLPPLGADGCAERVFGFLRGISEWPSRIFWFLQVWYKWCAQGCRCSDVCASEEFFWFLRVFLQDSFTQRYGAAV